MGVATATSAKNKQVQIIFVYVNNLERIIVHYSKINQVIEVMIQFCDVNYNETTKKLGMHRSIFFAVMRI